MTSTFRTSAHATGHRAAAAWRAALIGATVLALTGCAGASSPGGTTASPDPTAQPTASAPSASAPSTSAPSTSAPSASAPSTSTEGCPGAKSPGPWGFVIAAEQITDVSGPYCHTVIDPAFAATLFDPALVDLESLTAHGFTLEDAEAAVHTAVSYVAEQGLDSSRLDDNSTTRQLTATGSTPRRSYSRRPRRHGSPHWRSAPGCVTPE